MEAVSNELTRQVFEYWTQNRDLSVEIDVDKVTEALPNGQMAIARYLDVRVRDRRHGYTNNFGQRSSGFQWFFSFLAAFSEFENQETGVVVLLDEPATGLHARAQVDFLRFIDERLATTVQVIYTTHSPFMVQAGQLDRVRIVEDKGPEKGTVVSTDVLASDQQASADGAMGDLLEAPGPRCEPSPSGNLSQMVVRREAMQATFTTSPAGARRTSSSGRWRCPSMNEGPGGQTRWSQSVIRIPMGETGRGCVITDDRHAAEPKRGSGFD